MFLRGRLRRLESKAGEGPCSACGLRPAGPGQIVYSEGEERPKDADERCERCGRHLWFLIRVEYEEGPPTGEREEVWP